MLKKILLPLLMAAVVLPQSVSAAIIPNGTSRARGMVATQNSLSVSEKAAIKKLFTKMENAVNRGDLQAFLNLCSQETTGGLSAQQYKTFKSNMRAALALNKAYGVKFSLRNLKISDIEGNQAIVLVKYQYDISPEIMDELNAEQRPLGRVSRQKRKWSVADYLGTLVRSTDRNQNCYHYSYA
jgi:hypothetical protein